MNETNRSIQYLIRENRYIQEFKRYDAKLVQTNISADSGKNLYGPKKVVEIW